MGVAALRAQESLRQDRLFDDPYAQLFLDAAHPAGSPWSTGSAAGFFHAIGHQVAVRTRFLDDTLLAAVREGCDQVVLLASGMDSRPFRLAWPPGTTVFELDFADVLAFKAAVIASRTTPPAGQLARPTCRHVAVPADLREDWPQTLAEAGFDRRRPAAWLAEGILYALPPEAAALLLDRITSLSAPGSVLAMDHGEDSELLRTARVSVSPDLRDLWQGGPSEDLKPWLARRGWDPTVRDIADIARDHRRPVPPAFDPDRTDAGRGWLATARLSERR
ncbi:SAM-dependent methyltransferase [Nonomuraea zeae]|uniref:S-adenosyl-L-methionine-dependent methyltransferase n=1 Tax=Nonomuraea zeae TaxID=1642303 RepID=A0A5S4GCF7_9ACTN|nr:SAM-dependent methyltransferase [Nonomuraea zeae]